MPRSTHDTETLRTLLWEGGRVEINLQDEDGALRSFQSIKAELEDELSDGLPLEFRRASSGSRILASSWSAAVQDAEEDIVVSLKSVASGPASPAVYTPQLQQSPWFAPSPAEPSAVAMGGEAAEEKGMSAGRTVRKANLFLPHEGQPSAPLRHYRSFAQPALSGQPGDVPASENISPSSTHADGIRRAFGAPPPLTSSTFLPSQGHPHLHSPPLTPSPRSRDRSLSPPRLPLRAHSIAFDTPPATRRSSLVEAASASDMAKATRRLSHSQSASESLRAIFSSPTSFGDFFDNFLPLERKISEENEPRADVTDPASAPPKDDTLPSSTFTHPHTTSHSTSTVYNASRRWSSGGSSTASEESLATPAEFDEAHQANASRMHKSATTSVPILEKALQALQTGYTQTHGEEKQKVEGGSPRRARTCANLNSAYHRKTPPPPLPFLNLSADPLNGNRPGTPIALRTRPLPEMHIPPPPPPPPTRNPSKSNLRPSPRLTASASPPPATFPPSASIQRSNSPSRC